MFCFCDSSRISEREAASYDIITKGLETGEVVTTQRAMCYGKRKVCWNDKESSRLQSVGGSCTSII